MQVLVKSRFSSYNSKNNTDITIQFSEDRTEVIHYKKMAKNKNQEFRHETTFFQSHIFTEFGIKNSFIAQFVFAFGQLSKTKSAS